MKVALVETLHPDKSTSEAARIMMDTGNRRTYVTNKLQRNYDYKMKISNEF